MASTRVITDEELLQLPRDDGNKYEVVDGELRESPANFAHERIIAKLLARMRSFADQRQLGEVVGSNVLYVLPSGNRRGPDVSFVAADRLTPEARAQVFPRLAPDLAFRRRVATLAYRVGGSRRFFAASLTAGEVSAVRASRSY